MKMELIEGSETSAIRTQTPGNYQKENILHYKLCIGKWAVTVIRVIILKYMFIRGPGSSVGIVTG